MHRYRAANPQFRSCCSSGPEMLVKSAATFMDRAKLVDGVQKPTGGSAECSTRLRATVALLPATARRSLMRCTLWPTTRTVRRKSSSPSARPICPANFRIGKNFARWNEQALSKSWPPVNFDLWCHHSRHTTRLLRSCRTSFGMDSKLLEWTNVMFCAAPIHHLSDARFADYSTTKGNREKTFFFW